MADNKDINPRRPIPSSQYDMLRRNLTSGFASGFPVEKFPLPDRLRPCCVLGRNVKIKIKFLPVPLYRIINTLEPNDLGQHQYNAGFLGGDINKVLSKKEDKMV